MSVLGAGASPRFSLTFRHAASRYDAPRLSLWRFAVAVPRREGLRLDHLGILATLAQQLLVRALLHHLAAREHCREPEAGIGWVGGEYPDAWVWCMGEGGQQFGER